MMPASVDVVARGKVLDDFNVRGEARASERPLEEIMAQQSRVRRPSCEGGLERIDIVDALARIGALAKHVLIDVRNRRGIGIDAAVARKDLLKERAIAAVGQRGRDPRLKNPVALDDTPPGSKRGRLSGCAILPISRRTVSRGSLVSESSVKT